MPKPLENWIEIDNDMDLQFQIVNNADKLTVVYFFAQKCTFCMKMTPKVQHMAEDFPDVMFLKANAIYCKPTCQLYNIQYAPTSLLLYKMQVVAIVHGDDDHKLFKTIRDFDEEEFNESLNNADTKNGNTFVINGDKSLKDHLEKNRTKLCVIYFYGRTCTHCQKIAPTVDKHIATYQTVHFLKYDVQLAATAIEDYDLKVTPTFIFVKNLKTVARVDGADEAQLENRLKSLS